MGFVGRSVTRLEDRPLVTGRGRFAADVAFPHMLHMRVVRSAHAHGRIVSIDRQCGAGAAGCRGGLDVSRRLRHSADRFPPDPHRRLGALSPAHSGPAARALCRRAGRGSVRDRSLCGGGRSRSRRHLSQRIAGHPRRHRRARGIRRRPFDRTGDRGKVLRRCRSSVSRCACGGGARSRGRAPFRRSARNPWCDRALRCRQRRAGASRRRQGSALESRQHRPHAGPRSRNRALVRRDMSAAASVFAASSIPRTCWSASPRCGSAGR